MSSYRVVRITELSRNRRHIMKCICHEKLTKSLCKVSKRAESCIEWMIVMNITRRRDVSCWLSSQLPQHSIRHLTVNIKDLVLYIQPTTVQYACICYAIKRPDMSSAKVGRAWFAFTAGALYINNSMEKIYINLYQTQKQSSYSVISRWRYNAT